MSRAYPTPPARPHFTHHVLGDLVITAGLAATEPPMHALYRPSARDAYHASLLASEEISEVDTDDAGDFEPPTIGGEIV